MTRISHSPGQAMSAQRAEWSNRLIVHSVPTSLGVSWRVVAGKRIAFPFQADTQKYLTLMTLT